MIGHQFLGTEVSQPDFFGMGMRRPLVKLSGTTSGTTDIRKNPIGVCTRSSQCIGVINVCVSSRYSCTLCILCVITYHIVIIIYISVCKLLVNTVY